MRTQLLAACVVAACGHSPNPTMTADAASTPPGSDAAIVADAPTGSNDCTGLAYCDDFEGYGSATLANATTLGPWAVTVAGLTMTIDSVKPYKTGSSLHLTMPANTAVVPTHGLLTQTVAAGVVAGNDLYGRAMIFYSNTGGNDLPIGVHSWFFQTGGTSTSLAMPTTLNMGGGGAKMQLNYHPGDISVDDGTMTAGVWHCVQWQFDGSGTAPADVAKVWVDGVVAIDVPASKGWSFATPWNTFSFGFTHFQTLANPVEVFLDDFALDGSMIACPP
jgi:hypothetical protein